jgi:hypothetical protein
MLASVASWIRFRTLDAYNPRDRVYYMLTENKNWLDFSNHTYRPNKPGLLGSTMFLRVRCRAVAYGFADDKKSAWHKLRQSGTVTASDVTESLESIHDSFHNNIGGLGFMSDTSVAGV